MEKILLRWAVKLRANIHATVGAEVWFCIHSRPWRIRGKRLSDIRGAAISVRFAS